MRNKNAVLFLFERKKNANFQISTGSSGSWLIGVVWPDSSLDAGGVYGEGACLKSTSLITMASIY